MYSRSQIAREEPSDSATCLKQHVRGFLFTLKSGSGTADVMKSNSSTKMAKNQVLGLVVGNTFFVPGASSAERVFLRVLVGAF